MDQPIQFKDLHATLLAALGLNHEQLFFDISTPGTDHAGIATQNVVEKTLKKAGEIKHRDDLGREALVARIWEWKEKYGGIILQQLRALGASCDWTRTRFTMDPEYSRCVQQVFVDLYKKGLIYRGKRMVNWCPASLTALSDEEVIMKEQKGFMYHFKVEVVEVKCLPIQRSAPGERQFLGSSETEIRRTGQFLTIATTRPETIPADTAVAVNPKDERYKHLIGKHVLRALPLDDPDFSRVIPIIADEHVDFEFGTGVLKVTPAHDKADYEIGLRHKLPVIDVLTPDGKLTAEAGADLASRHLPHHRHHASRDHPGRYRGGRESQGPALPALDRQARVPRAAARRAQGTAGSFPSLPTSILDFEFGTGVLKVTPAHDKAD